MAVVVALAVSGCGSSGNGARKQPTASASGQSTGAPGPSDTAQATDTAATTGGTSATGTASDTTAAAGGTGTGSPGTGDPTQGVGGVWLAAQGSAKVQLVLGKGEAGLTSTSLCGGSYTERNGIGLKLTCMDGNKDRTTGHGVLSRDGETLTVRWTGGLKDTFARTGLPSN